MAATAKSKTKATPTAKGKAAGAGCKTGAKPTAKK
jgi:hypothetical protein